MVVQIYQKFASFASPNYPQDAQWNCIPGFRISNSKNSLSNKLAFAPLSSAGQSKWDPQKWPNISSYHEVKGVPWYPSVLHMQYQLTIIMSCFHKLFAIKILSSAAVQAKNAASVGTLSCQMLFYGELGPTHRNDQISLATMK